MYQFPNTAYRLKNTVQGAAYVLVCTLFVAMFPAKTLHAEIDEMSDWSVRGVVMAESEAMISSELVAIVKSIPFKEGQTFERGQTILEFDCRRYQADLRAAEADVETARVKVKTNTALKRHNAVGAEELEISRAKLNQAVAAKEALSVKTDQCVISAPFTGRVVERKIHEHEMPEAGAPLIKIVKDGGLEVDLIVPSKWLIWLRANQSFMFMIDEISATFTARIQHIGAVVDPISKTAMVRARLIDATDAVRPGMSGTASFAPPNG